MIGKEVGAGWVIGSDETSARVTGKSWWQWVLLSATVIYRLITDSRAAAAVTTFMAKVELRNRPVSAG